MLFPSSDLGPPHPQASVSPPGPKGGATFLRVRGRGTKLGRLDTESLALCNSVLACHVVNSNIAISSLPTLQISLGIVALFEKIHDGESILTVSPNIGEVIPLFQLGVWCEKCVEARHYAVIRKQLLISNVKQGSLSSFRPLTWWRLHRFVWKS